MTRICYTQLCSAVTDAASYIEFFSAGGVKNPQSLFCLVCGQRRARRGKYGGSMKKFGTKLTALALAGAAVLSMTACGAKNDAVKDNAAQGNAQETKEWVYVPEYVTLEDEEASLYEAKISGGALYYPVYSYNEETQQSSQQIKKMPLAGGTVETLPFELSDGGETADGGYSGKSLNGFEVQEDGSIAILLQCYENNANGDDRSWTELTKYDAAGTLVFDKDMREVMGDDAENFYISSMIADAEGRLYLIGDSQIWLFGADGTDAGVIDLSSIGGWVSSTGLGKDGNVYVSYYSSSGNGVVLCAVDFDKKVLGTAYSNFPGSNTDRLCAAQDKDFFAQNGTTVYEYDLATQTAEPLFDWLDCDINGSFVRQLGVLDDGRLYAVIQDWSTEENAIALLTKTPGSEVPQKQQIVMGSLYGNSDLQAAAVKFNRSSDTYHVSIKTYLDVNNWTENSLNDAIAGLNNDLASGRKLDLIDLTAVNIQQLAAKGVFEDLGGWLDKSAAFNRDDFLDNILEAYTIDGKLVCIPASVQLQTVVGRASQVGTKMGWTMKDMIAFADQYPEAAIFDGLSQDNMLQYCMMYNESEFINWEDGTCSFDNQDFRDILEFVNRFPEDYEWSEDDASEPTKIQKGEVLLSNAYLYNFDEIQLYYAMFGEDITCIGFPNSDGSAGCALQMSTALGINAASEVKEAAWSFLESYLTACWDSEHSWGFPTNAKKLQELAEKAVKVDYLLDENGNVVCDENGEVITLGGGSGIGYQDGWSYDYRQPTQEEVDLVLELLKAAKPISYGNSNVLNIIQEEAAAFFKGQKSVDEVATVIQSRVKIYVSENS